MALNFPPQTIGGAKPLDGTTWAAPNGQQWQYDAAIDAWRALGTPSGSGVTYRGPIDLTQDPAAQYANIVAGNFFVVETGANPVSSDYPGIAGDEVVKGMEVIFDGTNYAAVGNLVAYATTTVAGKIEIATLEEVKAGTSFKLAVTPITLDQYLDSDYQPKLPTGSDGLFLGHEAGSPKWKALPDGTEQVKGIVQLAKRDAVPEYTDYYGYYSGGGSYPRDTKNNSFSAGIAVTPYSIAKVVDNLSFADYSIVQRLESHFGIGGLPLDENGDLITHPVVTDDNEGFMSPDQKKQLEDNTQDISDINDEIDQIQTDIGNIGTGAPIYDADDWNEPPVGTLLFAFAYIDDKPELVVKAGDSFDFSVSGRYIEPSDADNTRWRSSDPNPDAITTGTWRCLGKTISGFENVPGVGTVPKFQGATLWQRIS